ncbi:hypothetical protein ACA910_021919 [Epithemia clementina (nom. ined.)]
MGRFIRELEHAFQRYHDEFKKHKSRRSNNNNVDDDNNNNKNQNGVLLQLNFSDCTIDKDDVQELAARIMDEFLVGGPEPFQLPPMHLSFLPGCRLGSVAAQETLCTLVASHPVHSLSFSATQLRQHEIVSLIAAAKPVLHSLQLSMRDQEGILAEQLEPLITMATTTTTTNEPVKIIAETNKNDNDNKPQPSQEEEDMQHTDGKKHDDTPPTKVEAPLLLLPLEELKLDARYPMESRVQLPRLRELAAVLPKLQRHCRLKSIQVTSCQLEDQGFAVLAGGLLSFRHTLQHVKIQLVQSEISAPSLLFLSYLMTDLPQLQSFHLSLQQQQQQQHQHQTVRRRSTLFATATTKQVQDFLVSIQQCPAQVVRLEFYQVGLTKAAALQLLQATAAADQIPQSAYQKKICLWLEDSNFMVASSSEVADRLVELLPRITRCTGLVLIDTYCRSSSMTNHNHNNHNPTTTTTGTWKKKGESWWTTTENAVVQALAQNTSLQQFTFRLSAEHDFSESNQRRIRCILQRNTALERIQQLFEPETTRIRCSSSSCFLPQVLAKVGRIITKAEKKNIDSIVDDEPCGAGDASTLVFVALRLGLRHGGCYGVMEPTINNPSNHHTVLQQQQQQQQQQQPITLKESVEELPMNAACVDHPTKEDFEESEETRKEHSPKNTRGLDHLVEPEKDVVEARGKQPQEEVEELQTTQPSPKSRDNVVETGSKQPEEELQSAQPLPGDDDHGDDGTVPTPNELVESQPKPPNDDDDDDDPLRQVEPEQPETNDDGTLDLEVASPTELDREQRPHLHAADNNHEPKNDESTSVLEALSPTDLDREPKPHPYAADNDDEQLPEVTPPQEPAGHGDNDREKLLSVVHQEEPKRDDDEKDCSIFAPQKQYQVVQTIDNPTTLDIIHPTRVMVLRRGEYSSDEIILPNPDDEDADIQRVPTQRTLSGDLLLRHPSGSGNSSSNVRGMDPPQHPQQHHHHQHHHNNNSILETDSSDGSGWETSSFSGSDEGDWDNEAILSEAEEPAAGMPKLMSFNGTSKEDGDWDNDALLASAGRRDGVFKSAPLGAFLDATKKNKKKAPAYGAFIDARIDHHSLNDGSLSMDSFLERGALATPQKDKTKKKKKKKLSKRDETEEERKERKRVKKEKKKLLGSDNKEFKEKKPKKRDHNGEEKKKSKKSIKKVQSLDGVKETMILEEPKDGPQQAVARPSAPLHEGLSSRAEEASTGTTSDHDGGKKTEDPSQSRTVKTKNNKTRKYFNGAVGTVAQQLFPETTPEETERVGQLHGRHPAPVEPRGRQPRRSDDASKLLVEEAKPAKPIESKYSAHDHQDLGASTQYFEPVGNMDAQVDEKATVKRSSSLPTTKGSKGKSRSVSSDPRMQSGDPTSVHIKLKRSDQSSSALMEAKGNRSLKDDKMRSASKEKKLKKKKKKKDPDGGSSKKSSTVSATQTGKNKESSANETRKQDLPLEQTNEQLQSNHVMESRLIERPKDSSHGNSVKDVASTTEAEMKVSKSRSKSKHRRKKEENENVEKDAYLEQTAEQLESVGSLSMERPEHPDSYRRSDAAGANDTELKVSRSKTKLKKQTDHSTHTSAEKELHVKSKSSSKKKKKKKERDLDGGSKREKERTVEKLANDKNGDSHADLTESNETLTTVESDADYSVLELSMSRIDGGSGHAKKSRNGQKSTKKPLQPKIEEATNTETKTIDTTNMPKEGKASVVDTNLNNVGYVDNRRARSKSRTRAPSEAPGTRARSKSLEKFFYSRNRNREKIPPKEAPAVAAASESNDKQATNKRKGFLMPWRR